MLQWDYDLWDVINFNLRTDFGKSYMYTCLTSSSFLFANRRQLSRITFVCETQTKSRYSNKWIVILIITLAKTCIKHYICVIITVQQKLCTHRPNYTNAPIGSHICLHSWQLKQILQHIDLFVKHNSANMFVVDRKQFSKITNVRGHKQVSKHAFNVNFCSPELTTSSAL